MIYLLGGTYLLIYTNKNSIWFNCFFYNFLRVFFEKETIIFTKLSIIKPAVNFMTPQMYQHDVHLTVKKLSTVKKKQDIYIWPRTKFMHPTVFKMWSLSIFFLIVKPKRKIIEWEVSVKLWSLFFCLVLFFLSFDL